MKTLYRTLIKSTILLTISPLFHYAQATAELEASCFSFKNEGSAREHSLCESYILGFLDGALLTDAAIIETLESERSDFMERVLRTRGVRSKNMLQSTYFAKICLPESMSKTEIVHTVVQSIDNETPIDIGFDTKVYSGFMQAFPCN